MGSRSLDDLTPALREKAIILRDRALHELGLQIIFTSTARTIQEQVALYAQGRQPLAEVNELRRAAKLSPITETENKHKVTWTLKSMHLVNYDDEDPTNDKAKAFDVAIVNKGAAVWDVKVDLNSSGKPDYDELGALGESIGLVWGGRFSNPDRPHFQEPA